MALKSGNPFERTPDKFRRASQTPALVDTRVLYGGDDSDALRLWLVAYPIPSPEGVAVFGVVSVSANPNRNNL